MTTDDPMRDFAAEIFTRADPDERRLELVAEQPEEGDPMRDFAARLFGRDQDGASA